jgi:hypothetical protein
VDVGRSPTSWARRQRNPVLTGDSSAERAPPSATRRLQPGGGSSGSARKVVACHNRTDFGTVVTPAEVGAVKFREQVYELALDAHGLVTTSAAAAVGVPAVELRKLAQRGALTQLTYGVYRFDAIPSDRFTEYAEAVLRVGEDAFLTHDAVLALHELALVNPRAIKVGTTRRVRRSLPDWVELVRRTDDVAITEYEGIRATTVATALLDCVGTVPRDRLHGALEEARRRGLVRRRDVAALTEARDPGRVTSSAREPATSRRNKDVVPDRYNAVVPI